tara:strand:+ start:1360 stop:2379 length:1020 start_codon:yes stop_codon:yes gene_type:complete
MLNLRNNLFFVLLLVLTPILFFLDLVYGNVSIPFSEVLSAFKGESVSLSHQIILFESRLPKAITAVLCGAALAVSGLLMQTLFRNPLAGPYILGISSGAGLGVAILVMGAGIFGYSFIDGFSLSFAAFLGATAVLFILFLVSNKVNDVMTLLILGVMIGAVATAIIGLIQYFSSDYQLKSFLIWTLGSLSAISMSQISMVALLLFIGIVVAFIFSKQLNALLLGEEYATTIGVPIQFVRLIIILVSGWLAGIITAYCGPIGFIGIVVPHLARLFFKTSNHYILIPSAVLIGANMLLISDLIANIFGSGISLPINSITAILGIPIVFWIIFSKRKIASGF